MNLNHKPTEEAYAELQQACDFFNQELFNGQLPAFLITMQRQKNTMGYLSKSRFVHRNGTTIDELALNPAFFAVVPLIEILQTIVHEQTHQWQAYFGKPSRSGYHNTQWANKMESVGLMPSSTGQPGGHRTGQHMGDYTIPGGLFDLATQKLLSTGFAVSWFDRFPEPPPPKYAQDENGNVQLALMTMGIEAGPSTSMHVSRPGMFQLPQTENKSNREKYTCPECRINAWGKPGLKLICADCNKLLTSDVDEEM